MANFRNRTRIVYFRVSEDEFRQFNELCQRCGARNMSDLARSAIELLLRQNKNGNHFEQQVTQRLQQLESCVDRLNESMARIATAGQKND